jgi:hypothetical protein
MAGGGGGGLTSMLPMALAIGATIATDGMAAPMIGEAMGVEGLAGTALGAGVMGAGVGGLGSALQGGSISDIAKASLIGGATSAGTAGIIGGLSPGSVGVNATATPSFSPETTASFTPSTTGVDSSLLAQAPALPTYSGDLPPSLTGTTVSDFSSPTPMANTMFPYSAINAGQVTATEAGLGNEAGQNLGSNLTGIKYNPGVTPSALMKYAPTALAGMVAGNMFAQPTLSGIQPPASTSSLPNYTGALGVTPQAYRGAFNAPTALGYPTYPARQVGSPTSNPRGYADGGPIDSTGGGANTIEEMSRQNATGSNQMYPQANLSGLTGTNTYQNATNTPISNNMISSPTDTPTDPYTGAMRFAGGGLMDQLAAQNPTLAEELAKYPGQQYSLAGGGDIGAIDQEKVDALVANAKTVEGSKELAMGVKANDTNALQAVQLLGQLNKIPQVQEVTNPALAGKVANPMASQVSQAGLPVQAAKGGIMNGVGTIGSYSDGGQMLKGPGDGMSDSIPAKIGKHQPARLADSEFVVPADVVSHLGNGSSDAGAKQLYAMMDRVRKARTGNKKQGKEIKPQKYMPA